MENRNDTQETRIFLKRFASEASAVEHANEENLKTAAPMKIDFKKTSNITKANFQCLLDTAQGLALSANIVETPATLAIIEGR